MHVESSIFKAYDIRGTYPDHLNEESAYAIGRGIATLFIQENPGKTLTLGVGGDMRKHTAVLREQLIKGLTDTGIHVVDLGLVSTPTYYFGVAYNGYDGGVQITASHNGKEYNGFKVVRKHAVALGGKTGIEAIRDIILNDAFSPIVETPATVTSQEGTTQKAVAEYIAYAKGFAPKPLKVVIDPAHAMGIVDCDMLFPHSKCEVVKMNFELDGDFPAHEADPLKPENTVDLQAKVVAEGADLGISFDGDADRVFIIDEKGERLPSPILYTILAHIEHEENPGQPLAYEIRLGNLVEEEFKHVHLVQTPVGHSLIKGEMLKQDALFGGEISGHYFFKTPWGTFEAPILLIIKFLNWLSSQDQPLSYLAAQYKRYISSGEINTKVASREEVNQKVAEITEKYQDGKQIKIDGIKVSYPTYWFSVRASNTEPLIRLIVEAKDQAVMEAKRDELLKIIQG